MGNSVLCTKPLNLSVASPAEPRGERTTFLGGNFGRRKTFRKVLVRNMFKNLLTPRFLMGCFPANFQEAKRPLRTKSGKRPIKVGKRPIKEGKRPIKAMVLVGISVGCLMGCFRAPPPWWKTAPLKRPIERSMIFKRREKGLTCSDRFSDPFSRFSNHVSCRFENYFGGNFVLQTCRPN